MKLITAIFAVIFLSASGLVLAGRTIAEAKPPNKDYIYVSVSLFCTDTAKVPTKSGAWPKPGMAAVNTLDMGKKNPMPLESKVQPFAFFESGKGKKHPGTWKECKTAPCTVKDSMGPSLRKLAREGTMVVIKEGKKVRVPYYRLDLYYSGKKPPKDLEKINKKICKVKVTLP